MALYTPPDAPELVAKVRRSLRDSGGVVFSNDQVVDFINYGLGELSVVRPVETAVDVTTLDGLDGIGDDDALPSLADLDYVWAVEAVGVDGTRYEGSSSLLDPDDPSTSWRTGWDFVGGKLLLPPQILKWWADVVDMDAPDRLLRVRGYRHRLRLDSATVGSVDVRSLPEEEAVVALGQQAGFEALMNDRALFQQWQTATHATDISANQLASMAYGAQTKWTRMRSHLYLIRRPVQGAQ